MQRTRRSRPFTPLFNEEAKRFANEDGTYGVLLLEKNPLNLTNRKVMNEEVHHL